MQGRGREPRSWLGSTLPPPQLPLLLRCSGHLDGAPAGGLPVLLLGNADLQHLQLLAVVGSSSIHFEVSWLCTSGVGHTAGAVKHGPQIALSNFPFLHRSQFPLPAPHPVLVLGMQLAAHVSAACKGRFGSMCGTCNHLASVCSRPFVSAPFLACTLPNIHHQL